MQITAAVGREKSRPFSIEQLEIEEPPADGVLVRVVGPRACHTDLIVRDQYYPVPRPSVLGHEGAGVVERVGALVTKVRPGDHVVLTYMSCGACVNCTRGQPSYCLKLFERNF